MRTLSNEIICDISEHVGKFGGDFTAWCIGTACDWHSPSLEAHQTEEKDDELICREAYTPASARAVRDYFVNECGMTPGDDEASQGGRLVYIYKKPPPNHDEACTTTSQAARHRAP